MHGEYDSYSGAKRTRDSQQVRTDAIVLAHCMNPMIPFECTDNPYFRLAYADAAWKDSSIKCAGSSTEAGTERIFSSEKLIHSLIRNQLAPDLVRAIMTIRWNYEAIQQFQGNLVQRDAAGAVGEDVEFVPYE